MTPRGFGVAACALIIYLPGVLFAKGETVKVTITGGNLVTPITITDRVQLSKFNVWSGLFRLGSGEG